MKVMDDGNRSKPFVGNSLWDYMKQPISSKGRVKAVYILFSPYPLPQDAYWAVVVVM